ncbi:unnamed protein product [Dimorphilus gyrociliatus]|uniref:Uncharacterized protein n=1 Tax=Dimorphilus gyrociliatus TaxID=2664684 RepID=A0A7I8VEV9_9ANNE|nr:unnamed protein product [Dimorphilus gyrociliatus]
MSLSGKFPVRILELEKRLKDVAAKNGIVYAANYTDDEIIFANEVDFEFQTWIELENVWGLYTVDRYLMAVSKDTIIKYDFRKERHWKSFVQDACRTCVLGDLVYITRMGNSSLTILNFKDGSNICQIENSLLENPLGVCEFFTEAVLVANNERKCLDLFNKRGELCQSITLKFEPSFIRLSAVQSQIFLYVVDSESPTVHFFIKKIEKN